MKNLLLFLAAFLPSLAHADGLKVVTIGSEFTATSSDAEKVKGVNVRIWQEITRDDCNQRNIEMNPVRVAGSGEGFYDEYFVTARTWMTVMACPLKNPVTENVYSEHFFITSLNNADADGVVKVSLLTPKGYLISKMFQPTPKSSFRQSLPRQGLPGDCRNPEATDGNGPSTSLWAGCRQSLPT
ncbi:MAG: hypothetical protein ACRER2_00975 [Methylococcales bacterium]